MSLIVPETKRYLAVGSLQPAPGGRKALYIHWEKRPTTPVDELAEPPANGLWWLGTKRGKW